MRRFSLTLAVAMVALWAGSPLWAQNNRQNNNQQGPTYTPPPSYAPRSSAPGLCSPLFAAARMVPARRLLSTGGSTQVSIDAQHADEVRRVVLRQFDLPQRLHLPKRLDAHHQPGQLFLDSGSRDHGLGPPRLQPLDRHHRRLSRVFLR